MGRNNKPKGFSRGDDEEPMDIAKLRDGIKKTVFKNGIEFSLQTTSGKTVDGAKTWICPGCNISFGPGISHVVVWESALGVGKRRHFHNVCWQKFQGRLF
ncbi:MAG: hypothetical protein JHD31_00880 [Rhodoluna sp.]|jgi:hypothetical protein|nr:hypothetical protein [Rhodoluna sp.]